MAKKIDTDRFYNLTKKKAAIESAIWQVKRDLAGKRKAGVQGVRVQRRHQVAS